MYKQDPYVLIRIAGGGGGKTKVDHKGGQHPLWDEELHFPVYAEDEVAKGPASGRLLKVSCYAVSGKKVDTPLGDGEVNLEGCLKTGEFDGELRLATQCPRRC